MGVIGDDISMEYLYAISMEYLWNMMVFNGHGLGTDEDWRYLSLKKAYCKGISPETMAKRYGTNVPTHFSMKFPLTLKFEVYRTQLSSVQILCCLMIIGELIGDILK